MGTKRIVRSTMAAGVATYPLFSSQTMDAARAGTSCPDAGCAPRSSRDLAAWRQTLPRAACSSEIVEHQRSRLCIWAKAASSGKRARRMELPVVIPPARIGHPVGRIWVKACRAWLRIVRCALLHRYERDAELFGICLRLCNGSGYGVS